MTIIIRTYYVSRTTSDKSDLVLAGESQVFYLHLFPGSSGEEYLVYTPPVVGVHYSDGTPISAHPQTTLPYRETRHGEEGTVVRYRDLHLVGHVIVT